MSSFQVPRLPTAFSLDKSRKEQGGRLKDEKHLQFIRRLPCLATGGTFRIEAAHIRYGDPRYQKPGTPMARKPDDRWTVPLTHEAHQHGQHRTNERRWWEALGIDPCAVAIALYDVSGDLERGLVIISDARKVIAPWKRTT